MMRTVVRILLSSVVAVSVCAALAGPALAESITSAISAVRSKNAQLAAGAWNLDAERALVERLDTVADQFHDLAASGTTLTTTARSLIGLMERIRARYTDVLDEIQAEIIRIDGDLEAAQDSERWQQNELLSMRVLYRLNWIRYESAMRFESDTAKRKRLLDQSARGFEEFMGSDNVSLTVEVLLGHGLATKAMRRYETAIADFSAALEVAKDPAMITRLRIGLVEVYLSTKRGADALTETARLMATKPKGEARAQALFLRSKALLLALDRQGEGATRKKYISECALHLEELYGRGAYWEQKVVQLVDAGTVSPDEWAQMSRSEFVSWLVADSLRRRDECDRAIDLYSALIDSKRFRAEALYGSGSCAFYRGRYADALSFLGSYLEENAEGQHAEQAIYLRFKGSESLYVAAADDARDLAETRYIDHLKAYLDAAPDHAQAFEAWFRLGDWHREKGSYIECAEAFTNVKPETMLSLKASYLAAQCYVEAVLAVPEEDEAPVELVRTAIVALDEFLSAARGPDDTAPSDVTMSLRAKATVMAASIVTKAGAGSMQDRLQRLATFEKDFGKAGELLPEVLSLRIVAHRALNDLDAAGQQLERLLSLDGAEAYRRGSLKKLGIVFLKEAALRDERGDSAAARRSRTVALRVYERLLEDTQTDSTETDEPLVGLQNLVDDLRAQLSAPNP